jgi:hypothetical protein
VLKLGGGVGGTGGGDDTGEAVDGVGKGNIVDLIAESKFGANWFVASSWIN